MPNFKLTIEYDGTDFHGWQAQKGLRTVQQEIEKALSIMCKEPVRITGSGRTDAGVHALGQVANFKVQTNITPVAFVAGLNSLLAPDVCIKECQVVPDTFHARFDAKSKTYLYRILNNPVRSAVLRRYTWHIKKKLDTDAMRSILSAWEGTHDFAALENTGSPRSNTIRTVFKSSIIEKDGGIIEFRVTANGFLKNMVRNMAGILAETGLNKIGKQDVIRIIESKDRRNAPATAPPQGLFLVSVDYGDSHS